MNLKNSLRRLLSPALANIRSLQFRRKQRGFAPHVIERTVCGIPLRLWIADTDGRDWYEKSSYLVDSWPEMEFFRDRMVHRGDVVLECGAHQGVSALLLSRWVGETGRVVAIDPVAHNLEVARRNLELNGVTNVELVKAAVGDRPGQTRIAGGTNVQIGQGLLGTTVDVVTIDNYLGIAPTLLKIDVEGAEGLALDGAHKALEARPRILMELHSNTLPAFGTSSARILDLLWSHGYEIWVLWDDHGEPEPLPKGTPVDRRVHIFAFPS